MRARQILSTVAIAGGLLIAPALPSQAAPSGGCPSPQSNPVLTMTVSPHLVRGAAAAAVSGAFTKNGCAIRNARVHVQTRPLVNGKPAGTWKTVTVVSTNTNGVWKSSVAPGANVRVRAFFSKTAAFPTTFAAPQTLLDAIRITMHPTTPGACKIHLTGVTLPVQANRVVSIQSRGAKGHFQGWTSIGTTRTHSDGTYSTTAAASCAQTYNLRARINGTSTNAPGHSGTTFGIRPKH